MPIHDFIPRGYDPRDAQTAYWSWLEANWDNYDVFVVTAPTGAGKTLMNVVTGQWRVSQGDTCAIMAPRKFHQDQYSGEYTWIPVLKGMTSYICDDCLFTGATCGAVKSQKGSVCSPQDCHYIRARMTAQASSLVVFNFYSYFINKMYKDVAIIDEGHGTVDLLYGLFGRKIWKCEMKYPDDIELTPTGIYDFLVEIRRNMTDRLASFERNHVADEVIEKLNEEIDQIESLQFALRTCPDDFLIRKKKGSYWGSEAHLRKTEQEYIYVKIMKVAGLGERILWPRQHVGKIILTSATLDKEDVNALGLAEGRRVGYYECPSEIPAENRPFIVDHAAPMTFRHRATSMPKIAAKILKLCEVHAGQRGLVHCTYDVAKALKPYLDKNPRFLFHDQKNKDAILREFLVKKKPDTVLLASGMSEGIDLKGDLARFQILTMLQWPSLEDDVMAWIANERPNQYKWMTIRDLIQKSGRIVRGADDWGTNYFIGSEFTKEFYERTIAMWPTWFRPAIIWVST